MVSKNKSYELESILRDVDYHGYTVIYISKLWDLLEKGSRAAGTWKALLDAWEEIGDRFKRADLHIVEVSHEYLLITKDATEPMMKWAQESN